MNSIDYMAGHIADLTGVTPQMVTDSTQKAVGQVEPYEVQDVKERFDPMGMAVEQGQTAIVAKVKADELETARVEEQGRFARAVADAMKPAVEVGALDSEGKTVGVPLEAPTMPEPRETVMAGISNVGINGRKGVFSELPFEAEDIPNGWEVIQTNDGGYMATPQEHVNEVVENERTGERSKSLGYMDEKKETHDRVVQIKTKEGHVLQRSEEHTSELQSPDHLVCRLLLEKKKNKHINIPKIYKTKQYRNSQTNHNTHMT